MTTLRSRQTNDKVKFRGRKDPDYQSMVSEGLSSLGLAVIVQAVKDAAGIAVNLYYSSQYKDVLQEEARAWLKSPDALVFIDLAGLDPSVIDSWLNKGCPNVGYTRAMKGGEGN